MHFISLSSFASSLTVLGLLLCTIEGTNVVHRSLRSTDEDKLTLKNGYFLRTTGYTDRECKGGENFI